MEESYAWDRVEEKCSKIASQVWSFNLTLQQKVNYFSIVVIPALNYIICNAIKGSGKYNTALRRNEELDKKFRKLLEEQKARYKGSCQGRLYLATELGRYGLKSMIDSLGEATI